MPREVFRKGLPARRRAHGVLLGLLAAIVAGVLVFDWDWLRGPLVNHLTKKSGREIRIEHLDVEFGWPIAPTVRLRGVYVENAQWATRQPMAIAREAVFTFASHSLWSPITQMTRVVLVDADISMERKTDGLRNWRLLNPEDRGPGAVRVMTLEAKRSRFHFINEGIDFEIVAETTVADADAEVQHAENSLRNNLTVRGKYQGSGFAGAARIGNFMSFRQSGEWFPMRGHLTAGKTRLDFDGKFADLFDLGPVDAQMRLTGATLSQIHPFLKIKPPASRPYQLEAHVTQLDDKYAFAQLKGKVGDSDIAGEATYDRKPGRPMVTAKLHSGSAELADLLFLAGMDYRSAPGQRGSARASKPGAAETDAADRTAAAGTSERVFSERAINTDALKKFDAHMELNVKKLRAAAVPVDSLQLSVDLDDGVLKVSGLDLGAIGGHIAGSLTFDASATLSEARASLDARNLRLERLMPPQPSAVPSEAGIRAQLKISGRGKSLAVMVASANGTLIVIVDGGSISNLVDAKLGLNLGKVLGLRFGGDRAIALHCGATAFDFRNGVGKSQALVLETEQTHTDGAGTIDLREQNFELLLTPQPKKPGLFTLNSSIRVQGAFKNARFKIDDRVPLRNGGAVTAPASIATLFRPLLKERGANSLCAQVLAPARTATAR